LRFLVSPCAYKGTLSALQLSVAIELGIREAVPDAQISLAPIADGGDGTLDALHTAAGGEFRYVETVDAIGRPVRARWLSIEQTAVVELACASGLAMLLGHNLLNALKAHTYGLGEVTRSALSTRPEYLFVCVGGSASTDGGSGMLTAMGARFLNAAGEPIELGGEDLLNVRTCDLTDLLRLVRESGVSSIKVAVDVDNPLLGEHGAAAVYGPQKGANDEDVKLLDAGLAQYARVLENAVGRSCKDSPGAGAAGGTAFGISAAIDAEMISGFSWLSSVINLEEKVRNCDVVITAEGCLDEQSVCGKAVGELAKLCHRFGKQLWAVPAVAAPDIDWHAYGIHKLLPTSAHGQLADATSVQSAAFDLCKL
jgi:glycerate 2-kinase